MLYRNKNDEENPNGNAPLYDKKGKMLIVENDLSALQAKEVIQASSAREATI